MVDQCSVECRRNRTQAVDSAFEELLAAETELITIDPVAAESLGRMVDLSNTAVTANRPADADKASRFAGQVIDNFLNK